jgi:hypothetical protein
MCVNVQMDVNVKVCASERDGEGDCRSVCECDCRNGYKCENECARASVCERICVRVSLCVCMCVNGNVRKSV